MSYHLEILTEGIFTKDIYCRPLVANFIGQSDTFMETSTYGNSPINNFKWLPIIYFLGKIWFDGKHTIQDFEKGPHTKTEFARGNLPRSHILIPDGDDFVTEQDRWEKRKRETGESL